MKIEFMNENNYLLEMAIPLLQAKERVSKLGKQLSIHFAYIFIFGRNNNSYNHWKNEIANFASQIDNIKIKKLGKLDKDFFIDEFLFHLDTDKDAELEINYAWVEHDGKDNKLPSITSLNLNRKIFSEFKHFRNECFEELAELFASKEDHNNNFYKNFIEDKLIKFNR